MKDWLLDLNVTFKKVKHMKEIIIEKNLSRLLSPNNVLYAMGNALI